MDLSKIDFKSASASDKDTLLQLMERYYKSDHLDFSKLKVEGAIDQLLTHPSLGQIWLMKSHSMTLGYIVLTYGFGIEFGGRLAFIDELFVEESYRGMGLGSSAVRWCAQKCRDQGISVLRLEVTPTNSKALALYTRLGFIDYRRNLLTYKVNSI